MSRAREEDPDKAEGASLGPAAAAYVRKAIRGLNPEAVILYGSRARGDFAPWSDYDLIFIVKSLPDFKDRWDLLMKYWTPAPLEPKAYTPREFLSMIETCNLMALDAVYEGKALHDRGFMKQARKRFEDVSKRYGLVKKANGWRSLNPSGK